MSPSPRAFGGTEQGIPSGTVQFTADGSPLGAPVKLESGVASLTVATLSHGVHTIAAEYDGDGNFSASANALALELNQVINFVPRTTPATYTRASGDWMQIAIPELMAAHASDADGDELTLMSVGSGTNGATVLLFGGYIYYLPSKTDPKRDTTDHLDYAVTDGFPGSTVTNQIQIQVGSLTPAAQPFSPVHRRRGRSQAHVCRDRGLYLPGRACGRSGSRRGRLDKHRRSHDGQRRPELIDPNPPAGRDTIGRCGRERDATDGRVRPLAFATNTLRPHTGCRSLRYPRTSGQVGHETAPDQ
jgi:hypothetical protein